MLAKEVPPGLPGIGDGDHKDSEEGLSPTGLLKTQGEAVERFLGKVSGPSCNGLPISGDVRVLRD